MNRDFVVYVAGPFRGRNHWEQEQNIRRAETLALGVWLLGATAICPHTNTWHFQGTLPDDAWLRGDLAMLARCDAILMTRDWRKSVEATHEREFALQRGLPVFYSLADLQSHLSKPRNGKDKQK